MTIASSVYQQFYTKLKNAFVQRELGGVWPKKARGENSPLIWDEISEVRFKELFGGGSSSNRQYFYRKRSELNPKTKIEGEIDDVTFSKALRYIGVKIPIEKNPTALMPVAQEVEILYQQFIVLYMPTVSRTEETLPPAQKDTPEKVENSELERLRMFQRRSSRNTFERWGEILLGTKFWYYFCNRSNEEPGFWFLQRSRFEFYDHDGNNLDVRMMNGAAYGYTRGESDSFDYYGKSDFLHSEYRRIFIQMTHNSPRGQPLVLILEHAPGDTLSNVLFGKYLSSVGNIASGNVVLEKIKNSEVSISPAIYRIAVPTDGQQYFENVAGVDKTIIQYLYDGLVNRA